MAKNNRVRSFWHKIAMLWQKVHKFLFKIFSMPVFKFLRLKSFSTKFINSLNNIFFNNIPLCSKSILAPCKFNCAFTNIYQIVSLKLFFYVHQSQTKWSYLTTKIFWFNQFSWLNFGCSLSLSALEIGCLKPP